MSQALQGVPDTAALAAIRAGLHGEEGLPASPGAVRATLRLADDDAHAVHDVAGAVLDDPVLTERVLRVANAAAMGVEGGVRTVTQAVRLLGLDALRTIALSLAIVDRIAAPEHRELVRLELSLAVAASCAARELADACGEPREPASILALLRSTGRLAVAAWAPQAYLAIRAEAAAAGLPDAQVARRMIGRDFAEIAQMAVRAWGLPERFGAAVARPRTRCTGAEAVAAIAGETVEAAMHDGLLGGPRACQAARAGLAALAGAAAARAADGAMLAAQQRYAQLADALGVPDALAAEGQCVLESVRQDAARQARQARPVAAAPECDAVGRPADYRALLSQAASGLTEAALQGASRDVLLAQAVENMHAAMGFARTLVALREPRGGAFRVSAVRGERLSPALSRWRLAPGGRDILNAALTRDVALNIGDANSPKIRAALPPGFGDALPGADSFVLLPMRDQGVTLGFLYGDRSCLDGLTDADDVALLAALRNQLLLALRVAGA